MSNRSLSLLAAILCLPLVLGCSSSDPPVAFPNGDGDAPTDATRQTPADNVSPADNASPAVSASPGDPLGDLSPGNVQIEDWQVVQDGVVGDAGVLAYEDPRGVLIDGGRLPAQSVVRLARQFDVDFSVRGTLIVDGSPSQQPVTLVLTQRFSNSRPPNEVRLELPAAAEPRLHRFEIVRQGSQLTLSLNGEPAADKTARGLPARASLAIETPADGRCWIHEAVFEGENYGEIRLAADDWMILGGDAENSKSERKFDQFTPLSSSLISEIPPGLLMARGGGRIAGFAFLRRRLTGDFRMLLSFRLEKLPTVYPRDAGCDWHAYLVDPDGEKTSLGSQILSYEKQPTEYTVLLEREGGEMYFTSLKRGRQRVRETDPVWFYMSLDSASGLRITDFKITPPAEEPQDLPLDPIAVDTSYDEVVNFEHPFTELVPGGNGRYLVLRFPQRQALGIFDLKTRREIGAIPTQDADARYAVGREKLILLRKNGWRLERWDLATAQKEAEQPFDFKPPLTGLAMGMDSDGPLVATRLDGKTGQVALFDLQSLAPLPNQGFDRKERRYRDPRVAARGVAFTLDVENLAPAPVRGNKPPNEPLKYQWAPGPKLGSYTSIPPESHQLTLDANGDDVFGTTRKLQVMRHTIPKTLTGRPSFTVPGNEAHCFLQVDRLSRRAWTTTVRSTQDETLRIPTGTIDMYGDAETRISGPPVDRRFFLNTQLGMIVIAPFNNNRLVIRPFDLRQTLEDAGRDFLFVKSFPEFFVTPETTFEYPIVTEASGKELQFSIVQTYCEGAVVDGDGVVRWEVPRRHDTGRKRTLVEIRDEDGQELRYSFEVLVLPREIPTGGLAGEDARAASSKLAIRNWTDRASGREIEGVLVAFDLPDRITLLREDGELYKNLPLSRFSEEDVQYVRRQLRQAVKSGADLPDHVDF